MVLYFTVTHFKFLVASESWGFWVIICDSSQTLNLDFKGTIYKKLYLYASIFLLAKTSQRGLRERGFPGRVKASGIPEKCHTLLYRYRNFRRFAPNSYFLLQNSLLLHSLWNEQIPMGESPILNLLPAGVTRDHTNKGLWHIRLLFFKNIKPCPPFDPCFHSESQTFWHFFKFFWLYLHPGLKPREQNLLYFF